MPSENGIVVSNEVVLAGMNALSAKFNAEVAIAKMVIDNNTMLTVEALKSFDRWFEKGTMVAMAAIQENQKNSASRHEEAMTRLQAEKEERDQKWALAMKGHGVQLAQIADRAAARDALRESDAEKFLRESAEGACKADEEDPGPIVAAARRW